MTPADEPPDRRPRAVLAAAAVLHVGLLLHATPREAYTKAAPIFQYDYGLHAYQAHRALVAFQETGNLWSYDPFVLAGQPANIVEDVTNKAAELFVILGVWLGGSPWAAYNTYVLALHVAAPIAGWAAARLFRLSRFSAALTVLSWVLLWHFDSLLHWFWHVGMIAWGGASYGIVLAVALLHRAVEDHTPRTYAALVVLATILTLVHPFAPVTLVLPFLCLYVRAFRGLARWEHAVLALGLCLAASTALVWIGPALRFRHYIGDVYDFLWPTASYVVFDTLEMLKDILMTGQPVRTVLRTLALALSLVAFARFRATGDRRLVPMAVVVLSSFLLAYLGGYVGAVRQTQPYRNLGPAMLMAALAAAAVLPEIFHRGAFRAADARSRAVVLLGALLALPPLVRTVLHYVPSLLPQRSAAFTAFRPGPGALGSNEEHPPVAMGHSVPSAEYRAVAAHLEGSVAGTGRVVVAVDWVLAEYLATFTRVPILGGIPQRNVPHTAAHPLRHDMTPAFAGDDPFARYLEQYAVAAVITNGEPGPVDLRLDLLDPPRSIGEFRVYRPKKAPSYFAAGHGRVAEQALNRISVVDASGPEVVLRFHWLETLACRPGCAVERAPAPRDPIGFIRVANPPARFEIYNSHGGSSLGGADGS